MGQEWLGGGAAGGAVGRLGKVAGSKVGGKFLEYIEIGVLVLVNLIIALILMIIVVFIVILAQAIPHSVESFVKNFGTALKVFWDLVH